MTLDEFTARYFAKQTWQLCLMTGRWQMTARDRHGRKLTIVRVAARAIEVSDGETAHTIKIANSWSQL